MYKAPFKSPVRETSFVRKQNSRVTSENKLLRKDVAENRKGSSGKNYERNGVIFLSVKKDDSIEMSTHLA